MAGNNVRDIDVYVNSTFSANQNENIDYVKSVNGMKGNVTVNKATVGLDKVDNTSDLDKPVSRAVQQALNSKANSSDLSNMSVSVANMEAQVSDMQDEVDSLTVNVDTTINAKISELEQTIDEKLGNIDLSEVTSQIDELNEKVDNIPITNMRLV